MSLIAVASLPAAENEPRILASSFDLLARSLVGSYAARTLSISRRVYLKELSMCGRRQASEGTPSIVNRRSCGKCGTADGRKEKGGACASAPPVHG
jgi:hypothetical protein